MITIKHSPVVEQVTVSVRNGWLEFWRGQSLIYDIALKDFHNPNEAVLWWRQLTGKIWFTPRLSIGVAAEIARFLHIS